MDNEANVPQGVARSISWEAPEHHHIEKGNDWFFALAIIVVAIVVVALLLDNVLFALLLGLAGGALGVSAAKKPNIIPYSISVRGIKIEDRQYPFPSLEAYHLDEDHFAGPQLLIKSKERFMPLLVMPIPTDHIDDIEDILKEKLEEEELTEPFLMKLLEIFGF